MDGNNLQTPNGIPQETPTPNVAPVETPFAPPLDYLGDQPAPSAPETPPVQAESPALESAPAAEKAPVQQAPVQQAPVQQAPVQQAPVQQPRPAAKAKAPDDAPTGKYAPLSPWAYVGYSVLYAIPLVGWIFLFIHTFSGAKINRRNYARSFWCALLICLIVFLVLSIVSIIFVMIFRGAASTLFNGSGSFDFESIMNDLSLLFKNY